MSIIDTQQTPVGWIRGGKVAGSSEDPDEYNWEVKRGQFKPSGNGWQPIYSQEELDSLS